MQKTSGIHAHPLAFAYKAVGCLPTSPPALPTGVRAWVAARAGAVCAVYVVANHAHVDPYPTPNPTLLLLLLLPLTVTLTLTLTLTLAPIQPYR